MNTIGERLEYVRNELGYSYKEFGAIVDMSGDAIRVAISRNRVKPVYVNKFVEKLNINKDWVLSGEGEVFKKDPNDLALVEKYLSEEKTFNPGEEIKLILESTYKDLAEDRLKIINLLEEKINRLEKELNEIKKA